MPNIEETYDGPGSPSMDKLQDCYIYSSSNGTNGIRQRPVKRLKTSHPVDSSRDLYNCPFVPLLDGKERSEYASARLRTYKSSWAEQESSLNDALSTCYTQMVEEIAGFLKDANPKDTFQIPTGLIVSGVSGVASQSLFARLADRMKEDPGMLAVTINASQCSNLKSVLKSIIQDATLQNPAVADGETMADTRKGVRLLNYDLQILYEYVQEHSVTLTILYFRNSDSIDGAVLEDFIDILRSWQGRIPLVLLFEIATSADLFKEKLPRATVRRMSWTIFETQSTFETMESIFKATTGFGTARSFYIGPNVLKMLFDRPLEHTQTPQAFVNSIKYIYMTHFFVNALSCMLEDGPPFEKLQPEHCEAIRILPTFRRHIESLLELKQSSVVRQLLNDNDFLQRHVYELVKCGQECLHKLSTALELISVIQEYIPNKLRVPWSKLYLKGMAGDLRDSPMIQGILISVRKLASNDMCELLGKVQSSECELPKLQADLEDLIYESSAAHRILRSEYDVHHESLRATVVAQKVQLSKHKSTLSEQDAAYTKIVDRIHTALTQCFEMRLSRPKKLPLHEIFLYDLKLPVRDVFAPQAREAVERALNVPHDYMDCNCCNGKEKGLSPTQPATAILYQLYLESGAIINISDLWSAFNTILGHEDDEAEAGNEEQTLALFYRGLTELKYLGMIKNSRKKSDHLTKLMWKGL